IERLATDQKVWGSSPYGCTIFHPAAVAELADSGFFVFGTWNKIRDKMSSLCPHSDPLIIRGQAFPAQEVIDTLEPMITEERQRRMANVIAERSYSVVPVMEGLYDRGNVSAVLRSAEA